MKYARQCSVTGEGMNEGYLVNDDTYVKYEADLINLIRSWNVDEYNELSDEFILTKRTITRNTFGLHGKMRASTNTKKLTEN